MDLNLVVIIRYLGLFFTPGVIKDFTELLEKLDELDDVQNIYTNVNLNNLKI